jgi:hypothetical protein
VTKAVAWEIENHGSMWMMAEELWFMVTVLAVHGWAAFFFQISFPFLLQLLPVLIDLVYCGLLCD